MKTIYFILLFLSFLAVSVFVKYFLGDSPIFTGIICLGFYAAWDKLKGNTIQWITNINCTIIVLIVGLLLQKC